MNQILATENVSDKSYKPKGGGPKDIRTIVKFFAIMLIVFGVFLVTTSSLAMFGGKDKTNKKQENASKPTIEVETKGEKQLIFKVMHDKEIERVEYSWDDGTVEVVNGGERKYIEKTIDIPFGENTFYIKAIDIDGEEAEYTNTYEVKGSIKIDIKQSGNNIRIDVKGKNPIAKVEYAWDDEETKELEVEKGEKEQSFELEVSLGEHSFMVKVTDEEEEVGEEEITIVGKKINDDENPGETNTTNTTNITTTTNTTNTTNTANTTNTTNTSNTANTNRTTNTSNTTNTTPTNPNATKPTVKLSKGDDAYVITAHDDIGLSKIEITTLSDGKVTTMTSDGKDFTYNFPLKEGDDNKIQIVVYNSSGLKSDPVKAKWTK